MIDKLKTIKISVEETEEMRKMHLRRESAFHCMNTSHGKDKEKYRKEFDLCNNWIHKTLQLYELKYAPIEYIELKSPKAPWVNYFDYTINFSLVQYIQ